MTVFLNKILQNLFGPKKNEIRNVTKLFFRITIKFSLSFVFGIVNGLRTERFGAAVYLGNKQTGLGPIRCVRGHLELFPQV
jgi:hypothetical protein